MKPIALIILDGWGHREGKEHNAILEAKTPFFDALWHNYPHTLLNASEEHVGLPMGTIGNSEIGHMTMGAGRVIDTDLVRISKAVKENKLVENESIKKLFEHIKKYDSTLHLLGMVSPAGVHSHQEHLYGLLDAAKQSGITKIAIHAFTDGRDSPPKDNAKYLKQLEQEIAQLGVGHIASVTGRYFAMDRDKNWQRTEKAEKAIFGGEGKVASGKASDALNNLYSEGAMDEYLEPMIFLDNEGKEVKISNNDGVFFFNFRSDRPRQLSYKIMERAKKQNLFFVTMTEYDPSLECLVAFPPEKPDTTLASEISKAGLKQSHIAETEKYAHVTFFFNGGKQDTHPGERHFLIESRKDVATHDQAPEMKAREIADRAINCIDENDDFLVINFANADMVGHTANKPAIITAVETVDKELKRVVDAVIAKNGITIITADHGNAEQNVDENTGELHTAHTLNLVPFIVASKNFQFPISNFHEAQPGTVIPSEALTEPRNPLKVDDRKTYNNQILRDPSTRQNFRNDEKFWFGRDDKHRSLADIAPTILHLLQIKKPASMTGESLLK